MSESNDNPNLGDIKEQILQIHDQFWKTLGARDIEARLSLCADEVTFIGTGLNEKAANKQEYLAINRKGVDQYPGQFNIDILWTRFTLLNDMAWVETEVEWVQPLAGQVAKDIIRNTVVFKQMDGRWLIVHVHGSMPDYRFTGQNYMSNEETVKRNVELEKLVYLRTKELDKTLEDLKSTQSQLIQSEKMASLGELTAGIAHEIQNPLNFVNNFSELSSELVAEMMEEVQKGNVTEAEIIAKDIQQNLEKVAQHGKRADAIVKGMLQHSRSRSGIKEETDVNALADEYLRLAYHGLRAKDKSFNATLKTDYDDTIGKINIVPQDIGRVVLNLITNAFYAVDEKKLSGIEHYEPTVEVKTKRVETDQGDATVLIVVTDNGNGIPKQFLDKIFQPFFTTKPTGQGTGLGLSMSYDIVTKGHGGEIKVDTKEKEGTVFTIILPI